MNDGSYTTRDRVQTPIDGTDVEHLRIEARLEHNNNDLDTLRE